MRTISFLKRFKLANAIAIYILSVFSGVALLGCSQFSDNTANNPSQKSLAWLNSGALSYGGPVPSGPQNLNQSTAKANNNIEQETSSYNQYSYGFSPTAPSGARSLVLDRVQKRAKLIQAGKELASAKLLDSSGLVTGTYKVAHKQRNPLWYAPQDYFSTRGLSIPAEGDKKRYLRGAFGDFALFLSPTEAIHSGPFALSELNGARIEEQDFSKIFYLVEVGDSITIN